MTKETEQRAAARETIQDAIVDSNYLAGAKAGWNAAQADDPEAAFAALIASRDGHLAGYRNAKAILAAQPAPLVEGEAPGVNCPHCGHRLPAAYRGACVNCGAEEVDMSAYGEMTPEEIRADNIAARAQMIAAYTGPVVSFDVAEPFYLGSCDSCGWVGSTALCPHSDDDDVVCPRCFSGGCDCGKVAAAIGSLPAPLTTDPIACPDGVGTPEMREALTHLPTVWPHAKKLSNIRDEVRLGDDASYALVICGPDHVERQRIARAIWVLLKHQPLAALSPSSPVEGGEK